MTDIHALKAEYGSAILDDENVSSVGVGLDDDGDEVLVVGVKDRGTMVSLPEGLSGGDYTIEEVGEFVPEVAEAAVAPQADHRAKHRPVPGGVSTGHTNITAGTTSYLLTDGDAVYTASNAHVYADINAGEPGDTILQPGPTDGGASGDQSATLAGSVPIEDGVSVDLAWAEPVAEHTTALLALTTPAGEPRTPEVGETVTKSGRTTQVTEGTVDQVDVSVDVNYGGSVGSVRLENQVITSDMSDGGDSGSAVIGVDDDAPVGLLFAGSDTATVINPAPAVEEASGMAIVTGDGGGGDPTPTAAVDLTLVRQTPDSGDIVATVSNDAGSPVSGASVSINGESSDSVQTGSDGVASFPSVPLGEYTIEASADGHDGASVTITADDFD